MPLEIPGFVYDPETNRYYKQASRSQESSNSQKVIQRITVSKAAKKRRTQREKKDQEKRWGRHKGKGNKANHLQNFRNLKKSHQPSTSAAGGNSDSDSQRRLYPNHENFTTLGSLLTHRECGSSPSRVTPKAWPRLCYESNKGLNLREVEGVKHRWFDTISSARNLAATNRGARGNAGNGDGAAGDSNGHGHGNQSNGNQRRRRRVRPDRIHFNAFLGCTNNTPPGYFWSRGASDNLVSDDTLVCTCFVPSGRKKSSMKKDFSLAMDEDESSESEGELIGDRFWPPTAQQTRRGRTPKFQEKMDSSPVKIEARHNRYSTMSPAIYVSQMRQHPSLYVFGFMGSGLECGKITAHRTRFAHQMLPQDVCTSKESVTAGTLVYKTGGTVWNAQCLDDSSLVSIGEREACRVLSIGEARIQSAWRARYASDVLAQAVIQDKCAMVHGLRNGQIHLADWRVNCAHRSQSSSSSPSSKCTTAGRSITELLSVPQDPHQFAVLGYSQLPRLWDIRMQRPVVRYTCSHLDALDTIQDDFRALPMSTIDSLKLGGTKSLRISSDCTLLGCIKQFKSITLPGISLSLIHIWSLKTGKTVSISTTGESLKGRSVKDFAFLDDKHTAQLGLPINSMLSLEQCDDTAETLQTSEALLNPLDTICTSDSYIKLVTI